MPQRNKQERREYKREYRKKELEEQQGPSEKEKFIKKWKPKIREKVR